MRLLVLVMMVVMMVIPSRAQRLRQLVMLVRVLRLSGSIPLAFQRLLAGAERGNDAGDGVLQRPRDDELSHVALIAVCSHGSSPARRGHCGVLIR